MLKKLISPLQTILLQKKMCPGCTTPLVKAKSSIKKNDGSELMTCKCGRIFVHDRKLDTFRRALSEEV
jgi:RNase P subunit RPR2